MSEATKPSGAGTENDGVNSDDNNQEINSENSNDSGADKTVSFKNHKRALDDMHKFKSEAQLQKERADNLEEEKLRDKQEWKVLAERHKADAEKWKKEAENGKSLFKNTQKYNAVKKAALESGLMPEALDDLEFIALDDVIVETTDSGRYAVHGAKDFIDSLKKTRPHWFKKDMPPNVNSGGGNLKPTVDGLITPAQVSEAERQWKLGKIPRSEYESIYNKYLTQKKQT